MDFHQIWHFESYRISECLKIQLALWILFEEAFQFQLKLGKGKQRKFYMKTNIIFCLHLEVSHQMYTGAKNVYNKHNASNILLLQILRFFR
jgi:hypothetical protein